MLAMAHSVIYQLVKRLNARKGVGMSNDTFLQEDKVRSSQGYETQGD